MTINTNIKTQMGGEVINAGGFGCIFSPPLKCEGSHNDYTQNISKLMTLKYATEEYRQIQMFKSILQTIPNYNN